MHTRDWYLKIRSNCSFVTIPLRNQVDMRRMSVKGVERCRWQALIVCLVLLVISQAQLGMAAPYYQGKTIKLIVGYKPGGGYDRMARLVAKYLPNYLPGKPAVIIENMEGAASVIAANYMYNIAKPDGLTIGTFNRAIPFAQLTKLDGVKFDVLKYAWIGSMAVEGTVFTIRNDLPFKTAEDLLKTKSPIMVGATGPTDTSGQFPTLLREYLGLNMKLIIYPSSSDIMLAVERKEVDGRSGAYSSLKPFIDRGLVRPIIRGRVAEKGTENLPVNEDLTTNKKGKAVMNMFSAGDLIGRPFVCPPGTQAAQLNMLREAFVKVAADPAIRSDAQKAGMEVQFTSAQEIVKVIESVFKQPPEIIAEFARQAKF